MDVRGVAPEVPVGRALVVLVGTLCLWVPWVSVPLLSFSISVVFLLLLSALVASLVLRSNLVVSTRPLRLLLAITTMIGAVATLVLLVTQDAPVLPVSLLVAVLAVVGPRAVLSDLPSGARMTAVVAACMLVLVVVGIWCWDGKIDVELYVRGGLDAMARGESPYAITVANPYSPADTALYYGPDTVRDGRVVYGFPYLPSALIVDLPMHLISDAVWMHLSVFAAALVATWKMAGDQLGRGAVVALGLSPSSAYLVLNYWIETMMFGFLVLATWGMLTRRRAAVIVGVGLLFSSKQYALFFVPAMLPVLKRHGSRVALGAVGLAALVLAVFVLLDARAFYRSVIEFQFKQPFRYDAVSLLPWIQQTLGEFPTWLIGGLPFLGILASLVVASRTRPGATSMCLAVGVGLLSSVLLSKVGFVNYYMFIGGAFLLAGVTWVADDPTQIREPSSQGSRGALGITNTR